MPRVISHTEVEAIREGGVLHVALDTLVTPLARERAEQRGVRIAVGEPDDSVARQVARQVVARLPNEAPEVIEAVVSEILSSADLESGGSQRFPIGGIENPMVDVCVACLETERARSRSRALLTVTGRNRKGIAAAVTAQLADVDADILDISQTLVADFFTMTVVFDTRGLALPFDETRSLIENRLGELGMKAAVMHEDVLSSLHRI
jgi:ACT domain-containing protein